MNLLYMTKNGRIEHFEGFLFQSVEPVFIVSFEYNDFSETSVLNPYEKHYCMLAPREFEIQPHMFSMKDISDTSVSFLLKENPLTISVRDGLYNIDDNLEWISEPYEYYCVVDDDSIFTVDGLFLTPKNAGQTDLFLYSKSDDSLVATCSVIVVE